MKRIIGPGSTGKTRQLMEYARDNDAVFVCSDVGHYKTKARSYGISGLKIMSYGQFYLHRVDEDINKYVIDDLDKFLKCFAASCTNIGYTINED